MSKKTLQQLQISDNLDCFAEYFEKVDLHSKTVKKSEFEECTFIGCDFSETFFNSCTFIHCVFENCNLSLMKLTNTKFSNTNFNGCKIVGVDWTMCDWSSLLSAEPLKFKESILNDNNFFGLKLEGLHLIECSAKEVDFCSTILSKANFSATDFKGSLFDSTHLENANFTDAQNVTLDVRKNHIKGAKFSRYEALSLLEDMEIVLV